MLEFLDNYENRTESKYPCISIDWVTSFEIQYIQNNFSNYSNSLDELSEINNYRNDSEDLYSGSKLESSEDLEGFDEFFGSETFEDENMDSTVDEFSAFFGDLEETESNAEEVSLEELLSISNESSEREETIEPTDNKSVFDVKLPVFVNDEKISEVVLCRNTLNVLNHYFKRKWILEISEDEKEEISEDFILRNILRL